MGSILVTMQWFVIILAAFIIFYIVLPKLNQAPLEEVTKLIKEGAPFIDVRTSREFSQHSVLGSKNFPLSRLREDIQSADFDKDQPIVVFCLSGTRSASAQRQLKMLGYTKVMNVGSIGRAQKAYELNKP